jgi:hypothetical protein
MKRSRRSAFFALFARPSKYRAVLRYFGMTCSLNVFRGQRSPLWCRSGVDISGTLSAPVIVGEHRLF